MNVPRPATVPYDDSESADPARVVAAARRLVRSDDLEEALVVAAAAIGEALGAGAVLRLSTAGRDLVAGPSGLVSPPVLPPEVQGALFPAAVDGEGRDAEGRGDAAAFTSSGLHATCLVAVEDRRTGGGEGSVADRTVAELLLHALVQAVDRIVTGDRFRESEANLERAVESHRLVGQAMGILMERHRIAADEAFEVLRRASQDHNVKLREIAQRVIETGAEPGEVVGRP